VTAHHPSALEAPGAADLADFAAWLTERQPEIIDAIDREASESTRDDGRLYYDRLPSDDVDPFNPWITARAPVAREVQS
jgi:hypothetical protein